MRNLLYIVVFVLAFSSCDDFLDINYDKSVPQTTTAANRLRSMGDWCMQNKNLDSRYTAQLVQYWCNIGSNNWYDKWGTSVYNGVDMFRNNYWNMGTNVSLAIEDAESKGCFHYVGAVKTLSAWSWMLATDRHGDLPLTEAFINKMDPVYDNQKLIYAHINSILDEAIESFDKDNSDVMPLSQGDMIYSGDASKWKKFAYALKARAANHISKKAEYNAAKVIEYVDNSFSSNDDMPYAYYINNASQTSTIPFWSEERANLESFRPSRWIIELMDGTILNGVSDPRLQQTFNPSEDDIYRGIIPPEGNLSGDSKIGLMYGKYWSKNDSKLAFVSYAEMQFVKAEAAMSLGNKDMAFDALRNGIRANMQRAGVADAAITSYLASAAVPQASADVTLSDVMTQKYIAMFLYPLESWTDLRRHDYNPTIFKGLQEPTSTATEMKEHWPRRWGYRKYSEGDWNKQQLKDVGAITEDGAYDYSYRWKKVWWDRTSDESDKVYKAEN